MSFARPSTQPQPTVASQANSPVGGQPAGAPQPIMGVPHPQVHAPPPPQVAANVGIAPPPQVPPRLIELLDQVKAEFATKSVEASRLMLNKNEADSKIIHQHMNELTQVRKIIYELDQAHRQMRERYESEISRLRHRLDAVQPQPPLFSRIQQTEDHSGQPLPVPTLDAQQQQQQQQPQPPQHQSPIPPPQPSLHQAPPQPSNPQPGGASGSSNNIIVAPALEEIKPVPSSVQQEPQHAESGPGNGIPAPTTNGLSSVSSASSSGAHSANSSNGSGANANGAAPSGSGETSPNGRAAEDSNGNGASENTNVATTASAAKSASPEAGKSEENQAFSSLADLNFEELPAEFKKETDGYKVVFNPNFAPKLDVDLVQSLQHSSVVCCVRFSNDGKLLATGCNRSAQIYDVATGELLYRLQDPNVDDSVDLYIRSVCFSPDGKLLATGAEDHKVRVWDIEKREIRHVFSGHDQDIYSLVYSANGRYVVSGSGDRKVKMWDVETAECYREFVIEDGVTAVAMSPDDRFVAAGSLDKSVRIWDVQGDALVENLDSSEGHEDSVYSVSYRPQGRELVSGSLDKSLKVWELSPPGKTHEGRVRKTIRGHKDYVLSVAVTPDSKWILSGSKDRTVQMWDADSGEVQLMLQAHVNSVISVAQAPTGQLFASGGGDFSAKIWRYTERS